jgi:hypothetical protein
MPHRILICHAPEDQAVAETACVALERSGHRCWLAGRDAPDGHAAAMPDILRASRLVLLILSTASENAPALRETAERASAMGLPLVSLVLDVGAPEPETPVSYRIAALRPPLDTHLVYLAAAVDRLLDDEPALGRALTAPPKPMPRAGKDTSWLPIAIAGAFGIAAIAAVAIAVD